MINSLISTRDSSSQKTSLKEAILTSQPVDGGLYTFRNSDFPKIGDKEIESYSRLSFQKLAYVVLSKFDLGISGDILKNLIKEAYGDQWFNSEITPVSVLSEENNLYLLELYHGPTFAFKDVALQFLPRYLSLHTDKMLRALGASSGDTISAAHFGVSGVDNMQSIFLLPQNGPSEVQRLQALNHGIRNAITILIDGDFDTAQAAIKKFNSPEYSEFKKKNNFISFNSIQILRILCQIIYYFYAYSRLINLEAIRFGDTIDFSVPSGNFGDSLAGEFAREMGLPIHQINIATNANDILHQFLETGTYKLRKNPDGSKADAMITLAPSQDITVSSNFERELFLACGDSEKIVRWMKDLKEKGEFTVDTDTWKILKSRFSSSSASDEEIIVTQQFVYKNFGKLIDPHTATGVKPYLQNKSAIPTICLATAHPLKFTPPVGLPQSLEYKDEIEKLRKNEERYVSSEADLQSIREAVEFVICSFQNS